MMKMSSFVTILLVSLAAAGCSSTRERSAEAGNFAVDETQDALEDAVGLPRERPGPVMVDEGDDTVPTPYGGNGSPRRCSTAARDIARLTAVLGPDIEEIRRQRQAEEHDHDTLAGHSAHFASEVPELAGEGARQLYRSTIVGLNPVRPVIRFLGGAHEVEREAREQQDMAQRRRAYLRGIFDGFGCSADYMQRAFERYGLIESRETAD